MYFRTKTVKGKVYGYWVKGVRKGNRVQQIIVLYTGRVDR